MQEAMLLQYLKDRDTTQYVEQLVLGITGTIDKQLFEQSWAHVVQANEMLRVLFRWEEVNRPLQIVLKRHLPEIRHADYADLDEATRTNKLDALLAADKQEKFSLDQVPFRLTLCRRTEKEYSLLITFHHILFDGWSTGIILKEWLTAYRMLAEGITPELPQKPRFKQFVQLQQQQDKKRQEAYWSEYLQELRNKPIPAAKSGSKVEKAIIAVRTEKRDEAFVSELNRFVQAEEVTQASVFYTAWGLLLQHYTNSDDVMFGATVSGRDASIPGIEQMAGLFINTLPLRVKAASDHSLSELLREVNRSVQANDEVASTSLTDIKTYGQLRSSGKLFDSIVVMENYPLDQVLTGTNGPLAITSHSMEEETEFDLTIRIMMTDQLELAFTYNKCVYSDDMMEKLASHYLNIVHQIVQAWIKVTAYRDMKLKDIGFLTKQELQQLQHINQTFTTYPRENNIQELFEEQVAKMPDRTAVVDGNRSYTYRELNERANRIARVLRASAIERDQAVGLLTHRNAEMVAAILGILKAGGAYMPLDPDHPQERLDYMLADGQVRLVMTLSELSGRVTGDKEVVIIENVWEEDAGNVDAVDNLPSVNDPEDLAYVMYTSGSTGKPKGVMVSHRNVVRLVINTNLMQVQPDDRMLQTGAIGFDALTFELFGALLNGASLHVIAKHTVLDSGKLETFLRETNITIMLLTSPLFNQLSQENPKMFAGVRDLYVGGDVLSPKHINAVRAACPGITVWNAYGPTENGTVSVCFRIDRDYADSVPIGRPISNSTVYVLGRNGELLPMGIPGELCVGGDGVARGYLNKPELTAAQFVPDPFQEGGMMYRTGDLARWSPDGNLEYLGRIDHQVKIRGQRIEPGEVETGLLQHEQIKEAAVLVRAMNASEAELIAYYVADESLSVSELRAYLGAKLPLYMIPTHLIPLDSMPLTPNGKVDRAALPKPEAASTSNGDSHALPETKLEQIIANAWKEVLGREHVGIHESYFEAGGNSLNMIQLQSRLKKQLGKEVPIVTLFQYPTIALLAEYLADEKKASSVQEEESTFESQASYESGDAPTGAETGQANNRDIAIIGMAGRFPGAETIADFWSNLQQGKESISFFTDEELAEFGYDHEMLQRPNFVKAKGVLTNVEKFDPAFFGYSPDQATVMDPQIRLLHESVWNALEDAGCDPGQYGGQIGLYAGVTNNFHWLTQLSDRLHGDLSDMFELDTLNDLYTVSTRIAHKLNLKGPALSVQTACSTSLVAVHLACQSIRNGDCDMAIAGGASVLLPLKSGYLYQEGMVKSPDGHCRAFDAKARGTIGGDGAGCVVLKPLDKALADGDRVYAVIKGSAINNDGSRKVGYTAPSVQGQAEVIRKALASARIPAASISYVEAHGTGTTLGDPIEIEALTKAYATSETGYCRIGSVKTNVGHLDAAAGVTGLIKTVLALSHKQIPPSLHFESANPNIDFANSPFVVNTALTEWKNDNYPLRAGVSSFGIGGTNAHVVLEKAPDRAISDAGRPAKLITLSARTTSALDTMTLNLGAFMKANPEANLADVAYTLQTGRADFRYRRILVCETAQEAVEALTPITATDGEPAKFDERKMQSFAAIDARPSLVFMFSGQGGQYVNMGRDLYENEPLFRAELDRCFEIYRDITGADMKAILYPAETTERDDTTDASTAVHADGEAVEKLNRTEYIQPVIFSFEYALARLLLKWGVKPDAMIGYSFGEFVAACLAGVFSLEDALRLIVLRGSLMQRVPAGAMLSVPLTEQELQPLLSPGVSLAVVNGPSCIVSGTNEQIDAFETSMKAQKYLCMRLPVATAAHSAMMNAVASEFAEVMQHVRLHPPVIPYVSTTTGTWMTAEESCDPNYWVRHMTDTVRFADGVSKLAQEPNRLFVEIGPGQDLTLLVRRYIDSGNGQQVLNLVRNPQIRVCDSAFLLNRVGRLWLYGQRIDWKSFHSDTRTMVSLPHYPFERQHYWIEGSGSKSQHTGKQHGEQAAVGLGKKANLDDWFYLPTWKKEMLPVPVTVTDVDVDVDVQETGVAAEKKVWLIFADECGLSAELSALLARQDIQIITVGAGSEFAAAGDLRYTINPSQAADYTALFADLRTQNIVPDRILHAWGISSIPNIPSQQENGAAWKQRVQELGFYSMLYLAQVLKKQMIGEQVRIWVLTNQMQAVAGESVVYSDKATVLGPCRVISQELPNVRCRSIDIVLPEVGTWQRDRLQGQLLAEFEDDSFALAIAYRDQQRWVQAYEPVKVKQAANAATGLRQGGVYLLTGGMGHIGLVLSEFMARTVQAKLVLTSRSHFPSRDQWDGWLSDHADDDAISKKINKIRELESYGAQVLTLSADVADAAQMEAVIAEAESTFGPLNGVIYAAGVTGDLAFRMLEETDQQLCEQHFRSKMHGLYVLEQVLDGKELDFCLLTSSLSPILGGLGFFIYSAANHFLDSFVHEHNRRHRVPWTSVNWDGWQLEEDQKIRGQAGASISDLLIAPAEGVELLQRILTLGEVNQIVVSTADLQARIEKWVERKAEQIGGDAERAGDGTYYARPAISADYEAPQTETERKLCQMWEQFFRIEQIGVQDDFFELGGDSLKAITVVSAIHKQFQVEIDLPTFFNRSNVRQLSAFMDEAERSVYHEIERAEVRPYYELSSAQKRLYLIQQMEQGHTGYNEIVAGILEGPLDRERLELTLQKLVERHESLRTSFELIDGKPMQHIHETIDFVSEYEDFTSDDLPHGGAAVMDAQIRTAVTRFVRPFDLSQAPLMRAGLIKLGEERHVLMVDLHHIVSDGLSQDILINDFMTLYAGRELAELTLQYKDFSEWQNRLMETGEMQHLGAYWLEQLKDAEPLSLRTDYPRPAQRSFTGSLVPFTLDAEQTKALKALCLQEDVTLFMALLAVFNVMLAKVSAQDDITVGTPIVGRKQQSLQLIIGKFVNMLPLRSRTSEEMSFSELLQSVRATTLDAFEHQDYQFEEMVKQLGIERDLARNPIFDVVFALQNMQNPEMSIPGLTLKPYTYIHDASHFDLSLIGEEDGDRLLFKLEYSTRLFQRETIERYAAYLQDIVSDVLANPHKQLKDVAIGHDLAEPQPVYLAEARGDFGL
ncbi:amino acid adenylation domain-containing protein [Paenibacillus sp. 481]|nr:amino acid adenylation domain-containing protein [Paenibacillus sp. 481]